MSYLTKDIEKLFNEYPNDKKLLTALKKELGFRNRPKAVKLLEKIDKRLNELNVDIKIPEQESLPGISKPQLVISGEQGILPGLEDLKSNEVDTQSTSHMENKTKENVDVESSEPSIIDKYIEKIKRLFRG